MGKRIKQSGFEDDGRVIAPMNVEGMPWYRPRGKEPGNEGNEDVTYGIRNSEFEAGGREQKSDNGVLPSSLTRSEKLAFSFGVLKAALLVTLVFVGALFAFILFCTEIWFK